LPWAPTPFLANKLDTFLLLQLRMDLLATYKYPKTLQGDITDIMLPDGRLDGILKLARVGACGAC